MREHYEDLLSLFKNSKLGKSRIFLVRPINRIGNRMSPGSGRAAIEPFANDRDVGIEVTRVLKGIGHDNCSGYLRRSVTHDEDRRTRLNVRICRDSRGARGLLDR